MTAKTNLQQPVTDQILTGAHFHFQAEGKTDITLCVNKEKAAENETHFVDQFDQSPFLELRSHFALFQFQIRHLISDYFKGSLVTFRIFRVKDITVDSDLRFQRIT